MDEIEIINNIIQTKIKDTSGKHPSNMIQTKSTDVLQDNNPSKSSNEPIKKDDAKEASAIDSLFPKAKDT
ncbi:MAG: hypothetical protein LGB70_01235 [Sulfurovum sp.]|nr:hypothetical protein [Sulfurovum sp.]